MFDLAWLIIALPAAGLLLNLFFGPKLGNRQVAALASTAVALAFVVAAWLTLQMWGLPPEERTYTVMLWDWLTIGSFHVAAALLVDPLSLTMALVVTGIGALIHVYSIAYMEGDEHYQRFFLYLNFFIFAMLILVLSDSFLGMFVGWEGVGLASFLLIGFWFDRRDDSYGCYADAGKKAFLVNRIGDFGMIVAMIAIWTARAASPLPMSSPRPSTGPSPWARRPLSACCCCWRRQARAPRSHSLSGCPMPWPAPRPSPR